MFTNVVESYDEWLHKSLYEIMRNGEEVIGTKETTFPRLMLMAPWNRYCMNGERKHDITALLAETAWVLVGRNDVAWLKQFLPRAPDFSDDGETWRAGYGPRLRKWPTGIMTHPRDNSPETIDQVDLIVRELQKSPLSRQAVISLWDPGKDPAEFGKTKDEPCNNWLSLICRQGQLSMQVSIRSNDLIWGNMINVFEWATMQEILAAILGMEVGQLVVNMTSLHVYKRHWERADKILEWYRDNFYVVDVDKARRKPFFTDLKSVEDMDRCLGTLCQLADATIDWREEGFKRKCFLFDQIAWKYPKTTIYFGWMLLKQGGEFAAYVKQYLDTVSQMLPHAMLENLRGLGNASKQN